MKNLKPALVNIDIFRWVKTSAYECGDRELVLIEVGVGDYLGEDDIVRLDDIYGRVKARDKG